jgi:hypothetical protein
MDWLTASEKDKARAQKRLVAINKRLITIGQRARYEVERRALLAERAELYFGDGPLPPTSRKTRKTARKARPRRGAR